MTWKGEEFMFKLQSLDELEKRSKGFQTCKIRVCYDDYLYNRDKPIRKWLQTNIPTLLPHRRLPTYLSACAVGLNLPPLNEETWGCWEFTVQNCCQLVDRYWTKLVRWLLEKSKLQSFVREIRVNRELADPNDYTFRIFIRNARIKHHVFRTENAIRKLKIGCSLDFFRWDSDKEVVDCESVLNLNYNQIRIKTQGRNKVILQQSNWQGTIKCTNCWRYENLAQGECPTYQVQTTATETTTTETDRQ